MNNMETKIMPEYVDHGFGFSVVLRGVPMVKVRGKWTLRINYTVLARELLGRSAFCKPTAGALAGFFGGAVCRA